MNLQEKILAALVAINAQYNLPKDQLLKVVGLAPSDLTEDKIESWVESQKPYLALMQSYSDSRVTAQTKEFNALKEEFEAFKKEHSTKPTGTGDLDERMNALKSEFEQTLNDKLKGYSDLQTKYEDLLKKQEEGDKIVKEKEFAEIKKRVATELKISDQALSLLEAKLTPDMTEEQINKTLAEGLKTLNDLGVHTVETGTISLSAKEAAQARANAYLDRLAAEQNAQ